MELKFAHFLIKMVMNFLLTFINKLKEIKDSYGKFKGEYEFVQFAEDMVKKVSQDEITDFLKDGVDDFEDYILGKIKEFEEQ
ncbi:MAG: hypothetical protein U0L74_01135 [Paludibacteraceae bacterium]|nr:hypothetical protein [Paludibacteraceae bacterium]